MAILFIPCIVLLRWELDAEGLLKIKEIECALAEAFLNVFSTSLSWKIVEISFHGDRMHSIAHVFRQSLRKAVLKLYHRLKEKHSRPRIDLFILLVIAIIPVLIIDINERWVVNIFSHHLRQKVSQEADKSLDILLAREKDFFSGDSRLPKLF